MANKNDNHSVRVCVLIGNFHPMIGGGEKHALLLCRELIRQGAKAMVITRRSRRDLPPRETVQGIPVIRVGPAGYPRLGKYLMIPATLQEMRRQSAEYDIVYVCSLRVLGLAGMRAARKLAKHCVLRAEALGELSGEFIWRGRPGAPIRPWLRKIFLPPIKWRNRRLLAGTRAFVSISAPVREEYLQCGVNTNRIADITNGIPPDEFMPATPADRLKLRAELNLPPNKTICAYSGKFNRGKGLLFLLHVWREIIQQHPAMHLLLIGGGGGQSISCEQELRDYIRANNLADSVTLTGYTQNVPDYLRAADFFLFPSESETLGLALLEALACELPAVASRIPGVTDIIRDGVNGLLAAPDNAGEWLNAINRLVNDRPAAAALGRAGRATVCQHFSVAQSAQRHLELFKSFEPISKLKF